MKAWERRVEFPVETMMGGKGIIMSRICVDSSIDTNKQSTSNQRSASAG